MRSDADGRHQDGDALGRFLRAARARVLPGQVGLGSGGERRVPGLKREELAILAGVSASYYTRLEQGQALGASAQVLDALATALRLDPTEREHLHRLAALPGRPRRAERAVVEHVDPGVAALVAAMADVPAMVLGRRRDILDWNPLGHALLAGHLDRQSVHDPARRPNATDLVFLDPPTRELYVDWQGKAESSVGHLRLLAARFPDDPQLAEAIGRLSVRSAEFAALWSRHRVKRSEPSVFELEHPIAGRLTVLQQHLALVQAPEQTVVVSTATGESASARALAVLAASVRPDARSLSRA